jgi:hypothetical protein
MGSPSAPSQEILAVGRLSMHKAFLDSVRSKWEAGMLERSRPWSIRE